MSLPTNRVPPQDVEAEVALLGSLLLSPDGYADIRQDIKAEDFYKQGHRVIYKAIDKLFTQRVPIDLRTMIRTLEDAKRINDAGGESYLVGLVESVPSSLNAPYYAQIVARMAALRRVVGISSSFFLKAHETPSDEAEDLLKSFAEDVSKLRQEFTAGTVRDFQPIGQVAYSALDTLEALAKSPDGLLGLSTGLRDLDAVTLGMKPQEYWVVGGRPSIGKTAVAQSIAQAVARKTQRPVLYVSLEMSAEQLVIRDVMGRAGISFKVWRAVSTDEARAFMTKRVVDEVGRLQGLPLLVQDSALRNVSQIAGEVQRVLLDYGDLALIVVDYLQLLSGEGKDRQTQVTSISRELKQLAKGTGVPVLALSQLNRASEGRADRKPRMDDLRESGMIEADADVVMLLHREDARLDGDPEKAGIMEMIITKQRNNPAPVSVEVQWGQAQVRDLSRVMEA